MTKEQILKAIEQNKDVLTPENYQGILKNVDIFTDEEKQAIVEYLTMAHEMMDINKRFIEKQNSLYKKTTNTLQEIDGRVKKDIEEIKEKAESEEKDQASKDVNDLLSNL